MPIRRGQGDFNAYLEVLLYCNRFQLATADALYSDGNRYVPAVTAVNKLAYALPAMRHVLVLGAGLGSMVRVLHGRGCTPDVTLVEKDNVVLEWAMEFLAGCPGKITPVCNDAQVFMAHNTTKFDFVFIDVFKGRVVPDFVWSPVFLDQCRKCVTEGGHVAFNYIVNDERQWAHVKHIFTEIFPENNIVSVSINKILIGRV